MSAICLVEECDRAATGRGWCHKHYMRWYAYGRVDLLPLLTASERFWAKVQRGPNEECWLWTGASFENGYGVFWFEGTNIRAHRFSYEEARGPIPEGLALDHLCRTRGCVNPAHLEAVSLRENILRGEGITARNARKTHCKHGHEFTPGNTIHEVRGRKCRICQNARLRERRARRLEAVSAHRETGS